MAGAVDAARANGERNGVAVAWRAADLEAEPVPDAELLLVNAPPPVHERVAAALAAAPRPPPPRPRPPPRPCATSSPRASSRPSSRTATARYATAGWTVAAALEEAGWAAARLERAGA